jgi:hypothetical protein
VSGGALKAAACALSAVVIVWAASSAATAEPRRHTNPARPAPERIVCATNNGCHEVPRGCRYEYRASGHGSVVVVLCDKK